MAPPVVGKRFKGWVRGRGDFVGRCISARGYFWEFKVENRVEGEARVWEIGDVMAVGETDVVGLEEIPLDAQG